MSAHYSKFPVAISLSTETLMHVLRDVFDSLRKHGLNRLLIVNGHDGNIPAIDAATSEYRTVHPEFKVAVLEAWWVAAGQLVPKGTFQVWGGLGHGGEGETSMMLRVDPGWWTWAGPGAWSRPAQRRGGEVDLRRAHPYGATATQQGNRREGQAHARRPGEAAGGHPE